MKRGAALLLPLALGLATPAAAAELQPIQVTSRVYYVYILMEREALSR